MGPTLDFILEAGEEMAQNEWIERIMGEKNEISSWLHLLFPLCSIKLFYYVSMTSMCTYIYAYTTYTYLYTRVYIYWYIYMAHM